MVRVAVVGVGYLGREHARLYAASGDVELVGVVDLHKSRAEEVAAQYNTRPFTDYREIVERVDAVSLAVPTTAHARMGVELLEAGVDVLVEKPIGSSIEEAQTLISTASRKNRVLQVGHVERFNPIVGVAREVATRPQFFEIHRLAAFSPRSLDTDVVLDVMIHDLDVVLSLVSSPVRDLRAVGIPVLSAKADIANARLEFDDGCVANLTASRVSFEKMRKLRFFQPHDYISIDYASQRGSMVSLRTGRVVERKLEPEVDEPLKLELCAFIDAVRHHRTPLVTGEDGLKALRLALSINEEINKRLAERPV